VTQLGNPYSDEQLEKMAQSLGVEKTSQFITDMVDHANWYIAAQEFISSDSTIAKVRSELKKFVKTAEGVLETNNKMVTEIEKLSPHTQLHISPVTRLRSTITATFGPLMDSIESAKHPIEGKPGRRQDTLRDKFLLEIVRIYKAATNKEFNVRKVYTNHPREGPDTSFLLTATTDLPGFQGINELAIEKALETALKR